VERADRDESPLLGMLPRVRDRFELRADAAGFSYVQACDETFVMPGLRPSPRRQARSPSLILVEARAAVGKSMLARYLAWATNSPLWDLADIFVGNGTLWGSLAKAFGAEQLNAVIGRTMAGEFMLVIDSLDEAEMHAGGQAFDAFLAELRDMYSTPRPAPSAILLGRTETIDYIEMFLGEKFAATRYSIDDFDRGQAYEFIDRRLDAGKVADESFKAGAHRRRVGLYFEARQRLYDFLAARLVPDRVLNTRERNRDDLRRVTSFLGYAPVLEAVAEYLASYASNYPAFVNELARMEADPHRSDDVQWQMLRMIVTRLLEREQRKVVAQVRKVIADTEWSNWDSLYGPDEQCSRVLARKHAGQGALGLRPDLPAELLSRYEDIIKNALPNHPFFGPVFGYANIVFRDYMHAWGLLSPHAEVKQAVRAELHSTDYLPAPLLGPFVMTGGVGDKLAAINGEDLGFVYESLLTQGESNIYLFTDDDDGQAIVCVGTDPSADVAVFRVADPDAGIRFWRKLSFARLYGDISVQLGFPGRDFTLGPDVDIDCVMLAAPARTIRVYTKKGTVRITASAGYVASDVEPQIHKSGSGKLLITWEPARYPWVQFYQPARRDSADSSLQPTPAMVEGFLDLCRIVRRFGAVRRKVLPYWGPIDEQQLFSRRNARHPAGYSAMVGWLLGQGVIFKDSGMYFLDARRLGALGVRLFELTSQAETVGAFNLVKAFLADSERL
jgi:hypothetical protein